MQKLVSFRMGPLWCRLQVLLAITGLMYVHGEVSLTDSGADSKCGKSVKLQEDSPVNIVGSGSVPNRNCNVTFESDEPRKCTRICIDISANTSFTDCSVSLTMSGRAGEYQKLDCSRRKFDSKFCSTLPKLKVILQEKAGHNSSSQGYKITAAVTEICRNYDFDTWTKEEVEAHKTKTYVLGIVAGACCALVFLLLLLITWCYYKNNPDRGPSMSIKMAPFKKKTLNVAEPKERSTSGDVGTFHYKTSEPDRLQASKHEAQPLVDGPASVETKDEKADNYSASI